MGTHTQGGSHGGPDAVVNVTVGEVSGGGVYADSFEIPVGGGRVAEVGFVGGGYNPGTLVTLVGTTRAPW